MNTVVLTEIRFGLSQSPFYTRQSSHNLLCEYFDPFISEISFSLNSI